MFFGEKFFNRFFFALSVPVMMMMKINKKLSFIDNISLVKNAVDFFLG